MPTSKALTTTDIIFGHITRLVSALIGFINSRDMGRISKLGAWHFNSTFFLQKKAAFLTSEGHFFAYVPPVPPPSSYVYDLQPKIYYWPSPAYLFQVPFMLRWFQKTSSNMEKCCKIQQAMCCFKDIKSREWLLWMKQEKSEPSSLFFGREVQSKCQCFSAILNSTFVACHWNRKSGNFHNSRKKLDLDLIGLSTHYGYNLGRIVGPGSAKIVGRTPVRPTKTLQKN